ncbi:MAG: glycosyltransferase family 4 protein [Thermoplasmata archaeon]|nr:glycosyltransferase family 4 protein [Thermoplasmata archaeon]
MKIAQVTLRYDAPGGVESTVRQLALGLTAHGHEVTVYASELYDEGRWERRRDFPSEIDGVRVRWFPVFKKLLPGITLPLWVGLIDALKEDAPDIIHAHSHRYGHVLEAAVAAHASRRPFVVSPHYHPADIGEPTHKRMLLRGQDFLFGVSAYREARSILVETAQEAEQLREFAPARKLCVIPPGIDLEEWAGGASASVAPGLDLPPKYLLFAGRIAPNKGVDVLLRAMALLPEAVRVPLVLVGKDWGERPRLERLARELRIDAWVRWAGHLPDRASYRQCFFRASALVLPSEYEAFGLVLLEAMAAGTPIVATRVGGVPEALEQGRAGSLVPYGSPDQLAIALREALAGSSETTERVRRGRIRVQDFATRRMIERHLEVYGAVGPKTEVAAPARGGAG